MDFSLTEAERELAALCHDFAQKEIARRAPEALDPEQMDLKAKQAAYHDWEAQNYEAKFSISYDERCIDYARDRFRKVVPEGTEFGSVLEIGAGTGFFLINLALAGAFVFLNACQVGADERVLGSYGGFASTLLRIGAGGVVELVEPWCPTFSRSTGFSPRLTSAASRRFGRCSNGSTTPVTRPTSARAPPRYEQDFFDF